MNIKKIVIMFVSVLMISGVFGSTVSAAAWPSLPSTMVQLTAVDGSSSYFVITLSGGPAGFDVSNGAYPGWCIDRSTTMVRSVPHDVMLYSSLSPPSEVDSFDWDAINYILNHKQGSMMDVQNAIWYFTGDASYGSLSSAAKAMVDAANASPFDSSEGAVLAVICLPIRDPDAQNSIIEIRRKGCGLSPGFWKHNIKVYLGMTNGRYSVPHPGEPRITDEILLSYFRAIGVRPRAAYAALTARGPGSDSVRLDMANLFNAVAGYTPYSD
jgi:hypothetical protein